MALDLSLLTKWTDENATSLISAAVLKGRTLDFIDILPGVKYGAAINKLDIDQDDDMVVAGGSCSFSDSGDTELNQVKVTVDPLKVDMTFCLEDLEQYYTSSMMSPGSNSNQDLPFEQLFMEAMAQRISQKIELLMWRGNKTTGTGEYSNTNGFLKYINDNSTNMVTGVTRGSLTASTTIVDAVDGMVSGLTDNIDVTDIIDRDDLILFIGYDLFRKYSKELRDLNLFHYNAKESQEQSFIQWVPGTNVRMVAVQGLNNQNRAVLTYAKNLVFVTDLKEDFEQFKIWWSEDDQNIKFRARWKQTVAIKFPKQVVISNPNI